MEDAPVLRNSGRGNARPQGERLKLIE
jgi:hypothetical protein